MLFRSRGLIPGLGRSPGEGHGNPPQYSCLENSMDRGAWWATVHGVAESQIRLNDFHFHIYTYTYANTHACNSLLDFLPIHVRLFATPWTVAHQTPLSMGFSRQEYWSGLPFPSPGDLPWIEPVSPALQVDSLPTEPSGKPRQTVVCIHITWEWS